MILAPYFVNVQGLLDDDSFSKIKEWVLKCNEVRKMDPSIQHFDHLTKKSIQRAKKTHVKPLRFNQALQYKNTELFDMLS